MPKEQHYFTVEALRSMISKVIRVAIRKVNCFCQKFGPDRVPNLIRLNDVMIKSFLRAPEAHPARSLLLDIYLNDECDIRSLYQTVSAVNEYIIMKDSEKMKQMIEAEPIITESN